MEELRLFALSVTAVSLLGGTILCLVPPGNARPFMKLLLGITLLLTLFGSWRELDWDSLTDWARWNLESGEQISAQGEEMACKATADIIKAECEAYILDKAKRLAGEIRMDLRIGEDLLPESVQIWGELTPNQKKALETILEEEIGIPKEAQHWSG